ncbi:MAG: endonuclease III domain-containing protein [Syntrophales bacterium]|jgi:endonuclease-3 related protein|nr:endonuclease III domain-containing protein [Syntrophales bacterium]
MNPKLRLRRIYSSLDAHFGDLHWWPGETPFEIIVGAILTQSTAWRNVETAIGRLKNRQIMNPRSMRLLPEQELASIIRPAGSFNVKAARLKAFLRFLHEDYGDSLDRMFAVDTPSLRSALLAVHGIGPETADSILLYAGGRPTFVVDAYTKRILSRHSLISSAADYPSIQRLFMASLPKEIAIYKQYHALIVETGKAFCRKTPICSACPLSKGGPVRVARALRARSRSDWTGL